LVVIDFHAVWCGPCKFIAPQFAALAERLSASAAFCKVDVDEAQELAQFARIRAMPTFQVYKAGRQVFEMTGIDLAKLERSIVNESVPAAPPALDPPLATVVPYRALMRFEEGQPAVIVGKVLEFADALRREGHVQSPTDDELADLRAAALAAGDSSTSLFCEERLRLLPRLLAWPPSHLFPVLDALRLALVNPRTAAAVAAQGDGAGSVMEAMRLVALSPEAGEVNHMMALRCYCNLLASAPLGALPEGGAPLIAPLLEAAAAAEVHAATRRGARVALVTFLLDAAVLLHAQAADCERKTPVVCALQQCLTTRQPDAEVRFRVVLALGTLVHADDDTAALCVALELGPALQQLWTAPDATDKLRACATDVLGILKRVQA